MKSSKDSPRPIDFGTGYGSFTYLKRLPVNFLKIDQEFVRDITTNVASRHVVRAVSASRAASQRTVAEGIEDLGTVALLGCRPRTGLRPRWPAPLAERLEDQLR